MTPLPLRPRNPSVDGSPIAPRILRVPRPLLQFRQAMPEDGFGAEPQPGVPPCGGWTLKGSRPIGEAMPPGYVRFRSTSE